MMSHHLCIERKEGTCQARITLAAVWENVHDKESWLYDQLTDSAESEDGQQKTGSSSCGQVIFWPPLPWDIHSRSLPRKPLAHKGLLAHKHTAASLRFISLRHPSLLVKELAFSLASTESTPLVSKSKEVRNKRLSTAELSKTSLPDKYNANKHFFYILPMQDWPWNLQQQAALTCHKWGLWKLGHISVVCLEKEKNNKLS